MVSDSRELGAIVSGGQTGVDRAALDFGRRTGTPVRGWCPAGGRTEDLAEAPGIIALYPELRATPSPDPRQRTEWNVRDSDATLVLVRPGVVSPGSDATVAFARQHGRPHLLAEVDDVTVVQVWITALPAGAVLNVAGPRESQAPGIHAETLALLAAVLDRRADGAAGR
ncbi:MAG TPA: putative molybdenum carrier protein [Marmoricola sp.]|nr:putative molybdenum carrier protein [Marmoricola sp.]